MGEGLYELKHKRRFQLCWKQEFRWVVLEDVGETPTMYCIVCHKFESKADQIKHDKKIKIEFGQMDFFPTRLSRPVKNIN